MTQVFINFICLEYISKKNNLEKFLTYLHGMTQKFCNKFQPFRGTSSFP